MTTNSHEQAERAGFDSLSRDQQEAMRRYREDGERHRRLLANAPEMHELLSAMTDWIGFTVEVSRIPTAYYRAQALLDRVNARVEVRP